MYIGVEKRFKVSFSDSMSNPPINASVALNEEQVNELMRKLRNAKKENIEPAKKG